MDREAVTRMLVGDRAKLLAYIYSLVHDHAAADDLYQDVLILATEKCDSIDREQSVLAWARTAARFRAIDHLRREQRAPHAMSSEAIDLLDADFARLDAEPAQLRLAALTTCMKKLSDYGRKLINLRFHRRMSGKEVAKTLDQSPHTTYTALSRTYKKLRDCIEAELKESSE